MHWCVTFDSYRQLKCVAELCNEWFAVVRQITCVAGIQHVMYAHNKWLWGLKGEHVVTLHTSQNISIRWWLEALINSSPVKNKNQLSSNINTPPWENVMKSVEKNTNTMTPQLRRIFTCHWNQRVTNLTTPGDQSFHKWQHGRIETTNEPPTPLTHTHTSNCTFLFSWFFYLWLSLSSPCSFDSF